MSAAVGERFGGHKILAVQLVVQLGTGKGVSDGNLNGLTFLFTGSLPTLKRSDAEALVEENGGQILGGVSAKLNYLVVGEDAGSKLEKAKKISSIKVLTEEEFLELMNT